MARLFIIRRLWEGVVLAVALVCWCAERKISGFGGITEEAAEYWLNFTGL
jgi:hypothetical protein